METHLKDCPVIVEQLLKSFYVDDVTLTEGEVFSLYQAAKEIIKAGGFNLRKFFTNAVTLQMKIESCESPRQGKETIPVPSEQTDASTVLDPTQRAHSGETKVLGVRWNNLADQLVIDLDEISSNAAVLDPTKRAIVSLVGKFYGPLGFLTPIVIKFKVFLQELCGMKIDWDQPLRDELLLKWKQLISSLQENQLYATPRCYLDETTDGQVISCQLYGFCDASGLFST